MALTMKNAVASRPTVAARPSRTAVVVRASAESRRAVLSGLVAGTVMTVAGSAMAAATSVDLFDDRKARDTGFDIIYEARDLDLDQSTRDGLTQARKDLKATIQRVKESETRIDNDVEPFIQKAYWTEAREQLRRQVGTLRFDLATLASTKDKASKKAALAASKGFFAAVEDLDLALRKKDKATSLTKLGSTKSALDAALASVL